MAIEPSKAFLIPVIPVLSRARRLSAAGLQVFGFAGLIALAAQVRVPVPGTVVPMTLQSAAVLLTALLLSPRRAVLTIVCYVAGGSLGLPFFSPGSAGLAGHTGGYLVGFAVLAWLTSRLKGEGEPGLVRMMMSAFSGLTVMFAIGALWLSFSTELGAREAILAGVAPFVPKAAVEAVFASLLARTMRGITMALRGRGRSRLTG